MAGDENTIVLGTRAETRDTLKAFEELEEGVVASMREAARTVEQQQFILDFDSARESLRDLEAEFEATGRTSAEALARAEAGLRKVAGALGFQEDLRLVAPEFEDISRASRAAEEAMERFGSAAERGGRDAQRYATVAAVAVEKLETAIEQTRRAGGPVPPEWEKRLASLRAQMSRNIETTARFAAAQKDVQDELAASTERAVGFDEQATSLTEGIIRRFPKAQAAIVGFGASLATLEVSYRQTREFVEFVRKHFGIDIDEAMKKASLATIEYVRETLKRGPAGKEVAELERNAANISEELRRREGETLEELTKRIDEYRGGVRKLIREQGEAAQATREFIESASGVKLESLEQRLGAVSVILRNFGGDFGRLAESGLFPQFSEEVQNLSEILDKYGAALRQTLSGKELEEFDRFLSQFQTGVREKLVGSIQYAVKSTRDLLEAFGVQTPEALRIATGALSQLIDEYGGLGKVTREQATVVANEADRILKAIALLPAGERAALAETVAILRATSDAYREHAEDVEAFAASTTAAIKKATAERIAAYEKERAALAGLTESAGSARDALLKSLEKPQGKGGGRGATDARAELADLKLKPVQSEEDIARIKELQGQLGGLRQKQEEARAGSEEVAGAIARFRGELESTGTALSDLDREGIAVLLSRLQQTAEESGATAVQISEAFAGVDTIVSKAQQRASELNGSAAAAQETARQAAATAKTLGEGAENIVASVDEAGEVLVSSLDDVRKGSEVVKATLDDAATAGAEWSKATKESGAAVDALVLGVDGLTAGMERVSLETAKAGDGLQEIQDKGEGAGEALKLLSTHAGDAAAPVARVADGLKAAAASVEPLHSSARAVHSMAQDAPGLARDLSQLEPATATEKRAEAYGKLAENLRACAAAAKELRAALPTLQALRDEAEALQAVAEALQAVTEGLLAERDAREGEEAPN